MEDLPERLKELRKLKSWSQEDLARKLGVSLNTVQRWEMGKTKPSRLANEKLQALIQEIMEDDQLKLL